MGEFLGVEAVEVGLVVAYQSQGLTEVIGSAVLGNVFGQFRLPRILSIENNQPSSLGP